MITETDKQIIEIIEPYTEQEKKDLLEILLKLKEWITN